MARSCCSMNQPLFNTELLSFILIQSCCLVFLPFSLIQSCCLVFLPFSLIQSCCLIVISMQYHYTPHQSHMQICRILPPQYAEDKIFGRTRKMCRRWRLCSFPRVAVFRPLYYPSLPAGSVWRRLEILLLLAAWASGGAICRVLAQPFAGDERILQVCPPLLFPFAVRDRAPRTLTKLFVFGSEPSYNILVLPTNFDFVCKNYWVYMCTPMSYAASAPAPE